MPIEEVKCPWCEKPFSVDPISTAKAFTCPECDRESSLGALRNPDLRPYALAIAREAAIADAANLHRHTAAYVYINPKGEEESASGTVVRIEDHHFLATVAHAVPRADSIGLVKKGPALLRPAGEHFGPVVRRVAAADIDVAAIELHAEAVTRANLEPIGIDRICDAGTGNPNLKARLIGYPAAYRVENYKRRGVIGVWGLTYGCEPIEPERWVRIPSYDLKPERKTHVVVDFTYDTISWNEPDDALPEGMPDPFGLSGGGLWQRKASIEDDELWSAEDLCLFAIQSCWFRKAGFLVATQIIHWLTLVAEEYPELRSDLVDRFPRLKRGNVGPT